jgi:hypothetical protein
MKNTLEVIKLITNMNELHTNALSPRIHKQFKLVSIQKNNRLYGSNVKGINKALELYINHVKGLIDFEEIKPTKNIDLLKGSHNLNEKAGSDLRSNERVGISCKYHKKDLKSISVRNIEPKLHKSFRKILIDKYGTFIGNIGPELSHAMELYVKVETGTLKVLETGKTVSKHLVESNIVKMVEDTVQRIIKPFLTTTNRNPSKKGKWNVKPVSKGEKTLNVLYSLMKSYENSFTVDEYKEFLFQLYGQADDRTVKSDLEALNTSGKIYINDKRSLYAGETFVFTKNHLYTKYNGFKANKKLLKMFRRKFHGHLQTTEKELNAFIQKSEGFFDEKSFKRRLEILDLKGLISPIYPGSSVYNIKLD